MKKLFLFFASVLFISVLSLTQAKATCPDGYWSRTVTYNYDNDPDCSIVVHYCVYMDTEILDVKLDFVEIPSECARNIIDWTGLYHDAAQKAFEDAVFQAPHAIYPPCSDHTFRTSYLTVGRCIKLTNDPSAFVCRMEYCDVTAYCRYWYRICYDEVTQEPVTELAFIETHGSLGCNEMQEIPPPYQTWDWPWTTECFNNGCN